MKPALSLAITRGLADRFETDPWGVAQEVAQELELSPDKQEEFVVVLNRFVDEAHAGESVQKAMEPTLSSVRMGDEQPFRDLTLEEVLELAETATRWQGLFSAKYVRMAELIRRRGGREVEGVIPDPSVFEDSRRTRVRWARLLSEELQERGTQAGWPGHSRRLARRLKRLANR